MKAMRLFDYLLQQKNLKPTAAFLSYKDVRDNKWKSYTYQETYERVLEEAKEDALRELTQKAQAMGANGILAVDLDFETVGGSMLMVIATGTAVRI